MKLPDKKDKLTPGFFMQMKKAKKLITLTPLTVEEKQKLSDE